MELEAPSVLWFLPAALAVLILLQFYRSRRREILAGSLLLWRRVAAQERAPSPRRVVFDLPFWLQVGFLSALIVAWAGPSLVLSASPGRRIVVVLDNGPTTRAKIQNGRRVWEKVLESSREVFKELSANDRVMLIAAAPRPHRLDHEGGCSPTDALGLALSLTPALSCSTAGEAWEFGLETAQKFDGSGSSVALLAISARSAPPGITSTQQMRWCTVQSEATLGNVGITDFGSTALPTEKGGVEVLVQVRNFGAQPETRRIVIESLDSKVPFRETRDLELEPRGITSVLFRVEGDAHPPLKIGWDSALHPDALPEDDILCAAPRASRPPRVRFHGVAPQVEALFGQGRQAQILSVDSSEPADLEIYVDAVPEAVPESARAVLFLAPPQSFGAFEYRPHTLERPTARLGESDPLTAGIKDTPEGLDFAIDRARELAPAGDLKTLVQDDQGHPLVEYFRISEARRGYVFAFLPGGSANAEKKLASPALGALLLRILGEASGARDPYVVEKVQAFERKTGEAAPLNWTEFIGSKGTVGMGLLDAEASALRLGLPSGPLPSLAEILPVPHAVTEALWPYLVILALVFMLLEMWWIIKQKESARTVPKEKSLPLVHST